MYYFASIDKIKILMVIAALFLMKMQLTVRLIKILKLFQFPVD